MKNEKHSHENILEKIKRPLKNLEKKNVSLGNLGEINLSLGNRKREFIQEKEITR